MAGQHLLKDPRVLMNLLAHERRQRAEKQARECWQFDVSLTMRRELACWMMEVQCPRFHVLRGEHGIGIGETGTAGTACIVLVTLQMNGL